jgi:hypothetical protein
VSWEKQSIFAPAILNMMKKTLIAVSAILIAMTSANAQSQKDSLLAEKAMKKMWKTNENSLKPGAGSFSTELNINPFKGELSLNNSLNQIKFRYFTKPDFAWRFGVNISALDSVLDSKAYYSSTNLNYKDRRKSFTIGLNLGFEKHLKGTKRLSPYIGGDISFTTKSSSQEVTEGSTTTKIKGIWLDETIETYNSGSNYYTRTIYNPQERAFNRFGLNVVSGLDFYMAKNFFFGYEFNFGLRYTKYKDIETTITPKPTGTNTSNIESETDNSSLTFGPSLMNGIRIGYVF